jgi:hypothetical protein
MLMRDLFESGNCVLWNYIRSRYGGLGRGSC